MTSIKQCEEYRVNKSDLIRMLITSAKTRNELEENRLYIGISIKQTKKICGEYVYCKPYVENLDYLHIVSIKNGITGFVHHSPSKLYPSLRDTWQMGEGIMISPWEAQAMLDNENISVSNNSEIFMKNTTTGKYVKVSLEGVLKRYDDSLNN